MVATRSGIASKARASDQWDRWRTEKRERRRTGESLAQPNGATAVRRAAFWATEDFTVAFGSLAALAVLPPCAFVRCIAAALRARFGSSPRTAAITQSTSCTPPPTHRRSRGYRRSRVNRSSDWICWLGCCPQASGRRCAPARSTAPTGACSLTTARVLRRCDSCCPLSPRICEPTATMCSPSDSSCANRCSHKCIGTKRTFASLSRSLLTNNSSRLGRGSQWTRWHEPFVRVYAFESTRSGGT